MGKQIISYTDFHYHSYPGTLDFPRYPLTDGALAHLGTFFTGYWNRDVMKRYMVHYIFGLMPAPEGLYITPCLPPDWKECSIEKQFRGSSYHIRYHNCNAIECA